MIHERLTDQIESLQAAGRVVDGVILDPVTLAQLIHEHAVLHNQVPLVIDGDGDGTTGWFNGHRLRTSPQQGAWILTLAQGDLDTAFEA